jgi:hypothetical protein
MSNAIPKKYVALLKEANEMFETTGCVADADGEPIRAETIVPDAKKNISETIDDPKASYDMAIWDTPGLRSSFRGSHKNGIEGVKYGRPTLSQLSQAGLPARSQPRQATATR